MADEHVVLTVEETARMLRIGRSAAYAAVHAGEIPAIRVGRKLRVPRRALEEMLSNGNGSPLGEKEQR
jgi:excisionase family DNA binding protein